MDDPLTEFFIKFSFPISFQVSKLIDSFSSVNNHISTIELLLAVSVLFYKLRVGQVTVD